MPAINSLTNKLLIDFINSSQYHLIYIAPGVFKPVAEALAIQWEKLGPDNTQIVLDVDSEICRLGYGDLEGLKVLQEAARTLKMRSTEIVTLL